MSTYRRAVLFANGEAGRLERLNLQTSDYLVAVDGGLRHLIALNHTPHLLIGDLDSVDEQLLPDLEAQGVQIMRFPPAKDQTDLELALYQVLAQGFKHILIVAALGGRLDQTLGNLALLTSPDLEAIDVQLDDGSERIFIIRSHLDFACAPGETVSLVPWGSTVSGITTTGLQYPLEDETLNPHQTRGISNITNTDRVVIHVGSGLLLCLDTRKDQKY